MPQTLVRLFVGEGQVGFRQRLLESAQARDVHHAVENSKDQKEQKEPINYDLV